MLHTFFSQSENFARLAAVACENAALPSITAAALTFLVTRLKAWNSATRYWAWWVTLAFVALLPAAIFVWHRPARLSESALVSSHVGQVRVAVSHGGGGPSSNLTAPSTPTVRALFPSRSAALFLLYCAAVFVQLSRLALGLFAALGLKRRAVILPDSFINGPCARSLNRRVSYLISEEIATPVAIGYWKTCILLPRALAGQLDAVELQQVLSHELAHINRYDDWTIAIQKLIEALFVIHPLVYLISRRIDLDREMACDDHVISSGQAGTYAACLTKIAELVEFGPAMSLTVPLLTRKSHLASRVEMVLDQSRPHVPATSVRRLVPFAIFAILAVLVTIRTPALFAFPAPIQGNNNLIPAKSGQAGPVQAEIPSKQPPHPSGAIDSIAITSEDGASTTFEQNGSERNGHSPFPHGTIVFGRDGASYIIRDHSTVAAAKELLRPPEDLLRRQEALGAEEARLGEQQAKLGAEQEALANRQLDAKTTTTLEKQLRNLESRVQSINNGKTAKTANEAQERISELQSLLGDIQSHLGDEQGRLGEAQGKLGEEQGRLGEQQGRLGDQQGKLGQQQAREAKRAEQKIKELIHRAEAQGLAQPLR